MPGTKIEKSNERSCGSLATGWRTVLLVGAGICIASAVGLTAQADGTVKQQFDIALDSYQHQAERIEQVQNIELQEHRVAVQAATDASLRASVPESRTLAEVANALPPGARLVEFILDRDVQPNLVEIKGVAASRAQVTAFLNALAKSPSLRGLKASAPDENSAGIDTGKFEVTGIVQEPAGTAGN